MDGPDAVDDDVIGDAGMEGFGEGQSSSGELDEVGEGARNTEGGSRGEQGGGGVEGDGADGQGGQYIRSHLDSKSQSATQPPPYRNQELSPAELLSMDPMGGTGMSKKGDPPPPRGPDPGEVLRGYTAKAAPAAVSPEEEKVMQENAKKALEEQAKKKEAIQAAE